MAQLLSRLRNQLSSIILSILWNMLFTPTLHWTSFIKSYSKMCFDIALNWSITLNDYNLFYLYCWIRMIISPNTFPHLDNSLCIHFLKITWSNVTNTFWSLVLSHKQTTHCWNHLIFVSEYISHSSPSNRENFVYSSQYLKNPFHPS